MTDKEKYELVIKKQQQIRELLEDSGAFIESAGWTNGKKTYNLIIFKDFELYEKILLYFPTMHDNQIKIIIDIKNNDAEIIDIKTDYWLFDKYKSDLIKLFNNYLDKRLREKKFKRILNENI